MPLKLKALFLFLLLFTVLHWPLLSHARVYDIYRPDYPRGAFCLAIGGACAAEADLANTFFQNPAALAVGSNDWNFDGDYSSHTSPEPGMRDSNDVQQTDFSGGFGISHGHFGYGASYMQENYQVSSAIAVYDDSGLPVYSRADVTAHYSQIRIPLAFMLGENLSLGIAPSLSLHSQELTLAGTNAIPSATNSSKFSLSAGAIYKISPQLRVGTWISPPKTLFETVKFSGTSFSTTVHYNEDVALHYPFIWAAGIEYTITPRLTLYGENDVIGTTTKGFLLSYNTMSSAINERALTTKGHHLTMEPRLGTRYIWGPKATISAGTYLEKYRIDSDFGREHLTLGYAYKLANWLETIGGIDVAKGYAKLMFSFR